MYYIQTNKQTNKQTNTHKHAQTVCQFGIDIVGADLLKPLNALTSLIAAMLFPINMQLSKLKAKTE